MRFGGGAADTVLHPLIALLMVLTIILLFALPKHRILTPLVFASLLIPTGQVVVLGGLHFTVLRIIGLCALLRLGTTKRLPNGFTAVDKAFALWAVCYAVVFVLQYQDSQAFINRLGFLLDAAGGYLPFRILIRDDCAAKRLIKILVAVASLIAVVMLIEQFTHRNLVGLLGGLPPVPELREGKLRSHGVFQHALLAGAFGATLLPLFFGLWKTSRGVAFIGILSASIITFTANSSTPLLAYAGGLLALCMWPLRRHMRLFRWSLVLSLIVIHLSMKAPVWALIARVDLTGSSSSFHRYMLIDNLIRHFDSWWLLGVRDYNSWGWDMWDLCDQYVAYGIAGGLATIVAFILIISRGYSALGKARRLAAGNREREWFIWCLCAALTSHVMGYFGIAYYDQTQVAWFMLLAMICAVAPASKRPPTLNRSGSADLQTDLKQSTPHKQLHPVNDLAPIAWMDWPRPIDL